MSFVKSVLRPPIDHLKKNKNILIFLLTSVYNYIYIYTPKTRRRNNMTENTKITRKKRFHKTTPIMIETSLAEELRETAKREERDFQVVGTRFVKFAIDTYKSKNLTDSSQLFEGSDDV